MINRYYNQCTDTDVMFESRWERTWQVFDRDTTDKQDGCPAIALCVSRAVADKIRDALNAAELK